MDRKPPAMVGRQPVGVVRVSGTDRLDLLDRLAANDLRSLAEPGRLRSTVFTTNKGRIVDWVWILSRDSDLLVRTSAGRGPRFCEWIDRYTVAEEVSCSDETTAWELLVVHGEAAASLVGVDLPSRHEVAVRDRAVWFRGLAAYGPRLEALVPGPAAGLLGDLVGRGGEMADKDTLEALRIEAGVPAAHREFAGEVNPLELRLGEAVSFDKGCYVGQEVLARMDAYDKLARLLVGFETARPLPEDRSLELTRDGRPLGRVTSVCNRAGGALGLGVVKRVAASAGDAEIAVDGAQIPATLCDRPFWL
jgi:folate-binding protein YgfZ